MKKLIFISLSALCVNTYASNIGQNIFPGLGLEEANIFVNKINLHNNSVYQLDEFKGDEIERNHFAERINAVTKEVAQVNSLIMHYTSCNFDRTLKLFTLDTKDVPPAEKKRVSAHYVISEEERDKDGKALIESGEIIQVVPESKSAWHAGISQFGMIRNHNAYSIGIEHVNRTNKNTRNEIQWVSFDRKQIKASAILSKEIIKQYDIKPYNVLGHADIGPDRKQDPGIIFPWITLYEEYDIGAFLSSNEKNSININNNYSPKENLPKESNLEFTLKYLQEYGYEVTNLTRLDDHNSNVILAFKSHFSHNMRLHEYTPKIDYDVMFWAWALVAKYGPYYARTT